MPSHSSNIGIFLLLLSYSRLGPLTCPDSGLTSETVNPLTSDRLPRRGSANREACTYTKRNTEYRGHTSILREGIEPSVSVFQRTVRVATDSTNIRTVNFMYDFLCISPLKSDLNI